MPYQSGKSRSRDVENESQLRRDFKSFCFFVGVNGQLFYRSKQDLMVVAVFSTAAN